MATFFAKPKRRRWFRLVSAAVILMLAMMAVICLGFMLSFWGNPFSRWRHGRVPLTPPWALECWLWEDDVNTAAAVRELLAGYASYDLPVRTILIDSPWSWRYNDFKADDNRYPEPEEFFRGLQEQGYRVVLWMTCMVNSRSKDTRIKRSPEFFGEARSKGYLAGGGHEIEWWKGTGGFIDYTNPRAMEWWQGLQQQALDWGVDGWKLDGSDTLFSRKLWKVPLPLNRAHSGWITTRQYMDYYARTEYQHGLTRNPEFVTLIRAKDRPWTHPEGFAPLDAAPVTWVGDNQHTWKAADRGLEAALRDILDSARLGYCVIGSDVAGYHGRSNPEDIGAASAALIASWKPKEANSGLQGTQSAAAAADDAIAPNIYIRWAEFSAFCGLFLNGGHGERRLWKRTQAELEIVRKFSWLHTELVPYMYSHVVKCHNGGKPLMRPLQAGKFHYLFGDDLLVAPVHEDSLARTVTLPPGRWRYLFDDAEVVEGPARITREFPLDEFPVYIRDGAILPLNVTRSYTGWGDRESAGFMTWLIYPNGRNEFTVSHPETHPRPETTTVAVDEGKALNIRFSGKRQPHILRIHSARKPIAITLDGAILAEGAAWRFEEEARRITVKTRDRGEGAYTVVWREGN